MTLFSAAAFTVGVSSTFFCAAINWYTHRGAYPLWPLIGRDRFLRYHLEYRRRLPSFILYPHVLWLFSSGSLLIFRPSAVLLADAIALFGSAFLVIGISLVLAAPIHARFDREQQIDSGAFRRLMMVSAARTAIVLFAAFWACLLLLRILCQQA